MLSDSDFYTLLTAMSRHAQSEYPKEACGIITTSFEYLPVKNISPNPKKSFIVDPISILQNRDSIYGFFHSHPGSQDPIPSSQDLSSTAFDEYLFVVGFGDKFYRYWSENSELRFETLNASHFTLT